MSQSKSSAAAPNQMRAAPMCIVKDSGIHGKGVFANRDIAADTRIIEYKGERITDRQAAQRHSKKEGNPFHTFFFSLESGKVIDGASDGNNARWINHGCDPNCEAREEEGRVFIYALRVIACGEELNYDYGLIIDERHTPTLKKSYACCCGAVNCRHTMLAPKRKPAKK